MGGDMKLFRSIAAICIWFGILHSASAQDLADFDFSDVRDSFRTHVRYKNPTPYPMPQPPEGLLELVEYQSWTGKLGAYITPDPEDGKKHPAIIWLTGGQPNTLGAVWSGRYTHNDQSALQYSEAGVVLMLPSLRGGNDNNGNIEGFFGEVQDIQFAANYLANLPYVDPENIYLGGHSTGGTLVFLATETDARFKATFSFGPVSAAHHYGDELVPLSDVQARSGEDQVNMEIVMRAPALWMHSVESPLLVIEGEDGNIEDLRSMKAENRNDLISFHEIKGQDHFNILAPINAYIADRIIDDSAASITTEDLQKLFE